MRLFASFVCLSDSELNTLWDVDSASELINLGFSLFLHLYTKLSIEKIISK